MVLVVVVVKTEDVGRVVQIIVSEGWTVTVRVTVEYDHMTLKDRGVRVLEKERGVCMRSSHLVNFIFDRHWVVRVWVDQSR
jgi:hypothetical protein